MKKSYQKPDTQIVQMQLHTLMQQTSPQQQGQFSDEGPAGGWNTGGANARKRGSSDNWYDDEY